MSYERSQKLQQERLVSALSKKTNFDYDFSDALAIDTAQKFLAELRGQSSDASKSIMELESEILSLSRSCEGLKGTCENMDSQIKSLWAREDMAELAAVRREIHQARSETSSARRKAKLLSNFSLNGGLASQTQ